MSTEYPRGRSLRWGVSVLLAAVLAAGCVPVPGPDGGGRPDGDRPGDSGRPTGTADAGDGAGTSREPVGGQEDGTMTAAEFRADIDDARRLAERYWADRLAADGVGFRPIRRVVGYAEPDDLTCGGRPLGLDNAAYCSAGDFIGYDVNWAVRAFRSIGDAFLFYLLGHEYAHGIQVRLAASYRFTIQQELAADCMAGAYIGDLVRSGALRLQDGDLDELRDGLLAVGDQADQPWFAPDAHGTAEQRTEAFFSGYRRSLPACDL